MNERSRIEFPVVCQGLPRHFGVIAAPAEFENIAALVHLRQARRYVADAARKAHPAAKNLVARLPKLHESAIRRLHPTQITVGIIEVADKCIELSSLKAHERREFLSRHPIPAVVGPEDKLYITDHHHLARAAWDEGIETGFFIVEADFSRLDAAEFWREMTGNHWVHPIDGSGKKRPIDELPEHLDGLRDDIYRSLAGYVRNAGGYDKTPTAFAEFMWADFFRKRVVIGPTRTEFDRAVQRAYALARSPAARELPGHRGS